MNRIILIIFFLSSIAFCQYADFASTGYSQGAADYLKVPVNANSAGLCGAVVAWRGLYTGWQVNPAISDAAEKGSVIINGSYSFLTFDRKHMGANIIGTAGEYLAWGASFVSYGVSNIEGRDSLGIPTDNFDYSENALTASLASRLQWNIAVGARIRYLFEKMETQRANGVGADIGLTWEPLEQVCFGASAQNLGSRLWWTTGHSDPVLATMRFGVCGLFMRKSLIAELDFIKTMNQPEGLALGACYLLFDIVSFRAGISTAIDLSESHSKFPDYSLGLGFKHSGFGFDYALIIPDSELGLQHKVSIVLSIKDLFRSFPSSF
jgi:hypothetical protein